MACHEARRFFSWEVEGSDELKEGLVQRLRRATIWSQHLRRYRSVFVKPVTPDQEAKTVVASGAAVLTFTHQRWRAVSRHSNVPSVLTTSQSSGGRFSVRASGTQDPRRLIPSCALHCLFCGSVSAGGSVTASSKWLPMFIEVLGAALASVSAAAFMLLCAATAVAVAGAFGTQVVCDGGFMRLSVSVTLIVSAGVFALVDLYFHFAGLQPAFEEAQQQAAAAGGGSLCLRGAGHTTGGRG